MKCLFINCNGKIQFVAVCTENLDEMQTWWVVEEGVGWPGTDTGFGRRCVASKRGAATCWGRRAMRQQQLGCRSSRPASLHKHESCFHLRRRKRHLISPPSCPLYLPVSCHQHYRHLAAVQCPCPAPPLHRCRTC